MKKIILSLVMLVFISCSKEDDSLNSVINKAEVADKVLSGIIANDEFIAKGGKAFKAEYGNKEVLSVHFTASLDDNCDSNVYDFEYEVHVDVPLKEGKSDYNKANVALSKKGVTPINKLNSLIIVKKITDTSVTIAIKAGDASDKAFMGYKNYVEGVFTVPICE